jgi:thiol:disulfide interchange protein DsbD
MQVFVLSNVNLDMSVVPQLSNPYLTSLVWGLLYGLVACTSTCLPYIASYIAGTGAGFKKGVLATVTFNFGRIIAYAVIGALIGIFSSLIWLSLDGAAVSPFQSYSSTAFSVVTIVIGAYLLYRTRKPRATAIAKSKVSNQFKELEK